MSQVSPSGAFHDLLYFPHELWVADEFVRRVLSIPPELGSFFQCGCGFALAHQLPTPRPCISHRGPLSAQRKLILFRHLEIPRRSHHNSKTCSHAVLAPKWPHTQAGAIKTDVHKKASHKRTNETVKCHFCFSLRQHFKILDNCQLPRSDCFGGVQKKQTGTLVFVAHLAKAVSQESLMRSSAEPFTPYLFQALVALWPSHTFSASSSRSGVLQNFKRLQSSHGADSTGAIVVYGD